jgi:hypothetical protein
MSRTQLYISPNRRGTVTLSAGSISVQGSGTNFTSADNGKTIIFRTSTGDIERKILSANGTTQSLTLNASVPTSQSGVFFYLEYVEVDLYDDIPFTLTYNIADIRNPDKRNGSFSKTVRLPGTDTNNALFGSIFEIDIDGSFNPNIKALAYIDIDTIEQFRGVMQLLQINRTRDFIEYEISVFGRIGSFFNSLGNKLLNEVDLSQYNHKRTLANINNSRDTSIIKNNAVYDNFNGAITTNFQNGEPDGEGYVYTLINNGATGVTLSNIESNNIMPAVYAKQIVDSIFDSINFTYTSAFFDSAFFKKLIIPYKLQKRKAKIYANLVITLQPATSAIVKIIRKSVYDNTQEAVLASTLATNNDYYTQLEAITDLYYGDEIYITLTFANNLVIEERGNLGVNDPGSYFFVEYQDIVNTGLPNNGCYAYVSSPISVNGPQVDYKIVFDNDSTSPAFDLNNGYDNTTGIFTEPVTNLNLFAPTNIKQVDYLMSLVKMFNLYIDIDKDSINNLIIEPYNDFMSNNVLDWTMKLDHSRQIEIYPMGELEFSSFKLSYKPDTDYYNNIYTDLWKQVYGEKSLNIDNDFVRAENKIDLIFSPTHLNDKLGLTVTPAIYKFSDNKTQPFDFNIRILHYSGMFDGKYRVTHDPLTSNTVETTYLKYPFTGHTDKPQEPTLDLLFDKPKQVYWVFDAPLTYTDNNLYNKYWSKYIAEITDKDSKIVVMYLNITVSDIFNLDFRKLYFIDNSYYRLNKIENYNPINAQVTKCEFLKIKVGSPFVAGDTDNPIDNLVNYNLVIGGVDEIRNIAADSFYNVVVGGKDEVRSLAATSNIHIIRG